MHSISTGASSADDTYGGFFGSVNNQVLPCAAVQMVSSCICQICKALLPLLQFDVNMLANASEALRA